MTLIPEGTWRGRGVTAELGYTSQENEQVGVALVFSPGQDADVDNRGLTWYGGFGEKSERHTFKALRVLGWTGDNLGDLSGIDTNEVDIVVAHEEDQHGELRARARFINPIGSGGVAMKTKMTPEQTAAFAERMRGRVLALGAATPPTSQSKPAAAPAGVRPPKRQPAAAASAPPDSDDIPF